ncbi:hypothetical protein BDP81DRAFT_160213 [Colletotrichum phormii]|uniref:Uncharacterized protein n=1 Tax=Colletotrichum phormii TaxID=359342 RepID=A0AAI9ZXZ0_9PEZI|nr:uncharacterized protein BDP81DRAFT_160213 [Colletotrichum phormii]KAK1640246.1 hypothetical protein BDP81DRAFT_160213 [Colletotrichum phormii]
MQREETQLFVDSDPVSGDEASENTQSIVQSIDRRAGRYFASVCLFCSDTSSDSRNGSRTWTGHGFDSTLFSLWSCDREANPTDCQITACRPRKATSHLSAGTADCRVAEETWKKRGVWAWHAGLGRCLPVSLFLVEPTGIGRRTGLGETFIERAGLLAGKTELKHFQPWLSSAGSPIRCMPHASRSHSRR